MASEEKAMNVYTTDSIRNVVLLGHGGSGKTSLVRGDGICVRSDRTSW